MFPWARYGGQQGQPTLRHSSRTHHSSSNCMPGKRHVKTSHQSVAVSLLLSPARISFVPQTWSTCSASACYWQYGSAFQHLQSSVMQRLLGLKLNSKSKQRSTKHAVGYENFTGEQTFFDGFLNIQSNVKGKFPLMTKSTIQIKCVS